MNGLDFDEFVEYYENCMTSGAWDGITERAGSGFATQCIFGRYVERVAEVKHRYDNKKKQAWFQKEGNWSRLYFDGWHKDGKGFMQSIKNNIHTFEF